MNKLTLLSRLILFLTSYIPLGIICLIIDFEKFSYPFFKHYYLSIPLFILMDLLILMLFLFLKYFDEKTANTETMDLIKVQNMNGEILSYIFTYILPFLGFPADKQLPISLFLLLIIGILYTKSDMIGINPILSICGYHLLKIEWTKDDWDDPQEVIVISKFDYYTVKHTDKVLSTKIQEGLHLIREIK